MKKTLFIILAILGLITSVQARRTKNKITGSSAQELYMIMVESSQAGSNLVDDLVITEESMSSKQIVIKKVKNTSGNIECKEIQVESSPKKYYCNIVRTEN